MLVRTAGMVLMMPPPREARLQLPMISRRALASHGVVAGNVAASEV